MRLWKKTPQLEEGKTYEEETLASAQEKEEYLREHTQMWASAEVEWDDAEQLGYVRVMPLHKEVAYESVGIPMGPHMLVFDLTEERELIGFEVLVNWVENRSMPRAFEEGREQGSFRPYEDK